MFIQSRVGEWNKWIPFSLATPPQEYELPLAEGIEKLLAMYWKDQFNIVSGCFNIQLLSIQPDEFPIIATLPEGFRPQYSCFSVAVTSEGEAIGLSIDTLGVIRLENAKVDLSGKYCKALFSFVSVN